MLLATLAQQSNRADWIESIEFVDDDDNQPFDLTGGEIVISVRDENGCQVLSASTSAGSVVIVSTGVAEFTFPRSSMVNLPADTYEVGGTFTRGGETTQFLIGQLPVLDGVVQR